VSRNSVGACIAMESWLASTSLKSSFYLGLLCLQVCLQPVLTKAFLKPGIKKSTLVVTAELLKIVICLLQLSFVGELRKEYNKWSFHDSLITAALPAFIYAVQNIAIWIAYQNTSGLTFNIVNQTKIIFTAVFLYLVLNKQRSKTQVVALFILSLSATIVSLPVDDWSSFTSKDDSHVPVETHYYGILVALFGSLLSGLAATLCQYSLQGRGRNSKVFTIELAVFGTAAIAASSYVTTGEFPLDYSDWDLNTLVPVIGQAAGGYITGEVTKRSGGIKKGYAVSAGVVLTAFFEAYTDIQHSLDVRHTLSLPLLISSVYLYNLPETDITVEKKSN